MRDGDGDWDKRLVGQKQATVINETGSDNNTQRIIGAYPGMNPRQRFQRDEGSNGTKVPHEANYAIIKISSLIAS